MAKCCPRTTYVRPPLHMYMAVVEASPDDIRRLEAHLNVHYAFASARGSLLMQQAGPRQMNYQFVTCRRFLRGTQMIRLSRIVFRQDFYIHLSIDVIKPVVSIACVCVQVRGMRVRAGERTCSRAQLLPPPPLRHPPLQLPSLPPLHCVRFE